MRYVIADAQGSFWSHLFDEDGEVVERSCAFVFDTEDGRITTLQIERDDKWQVASRSEIADLEDSLKNANPDALDAPAGYGLRASEAQSYWLGAARA